MRGHKYLLIFAQFSTLRPLLNFDPLQTYERAKKIVVMIIGGGTSPKTEL